MAVFAGDEVVLVDARRGWHSSATGHIAALLRELFAAGETPAKLALLAESIPALAAAIHWAKSRALPLSAANALSLGGFGTLFLELVGRCNERCTHCYASAGPEVGAALSRTEVDAVLADAAALGFSRVQLTGGDPLLCKFLPEAALRTRELGIEVCEIYTNGLALSARLLEALLPARPCFAFSFYSHRPETHDAITQTAGSQKRTLEAIERVLAAGLSARAAVVATADNHAEVADTVAFLNDVGVTRVSVSESFEVGRGQRFSAPLPDTAAHAGSHSGVASQEGKLCVTYDGDVVGCIFARDLPLGNIRERSLRDIAESPRRRRSLESTDELLARVGRELSCTSCRLTRTALHVHRGLRG